MQNIIAEHEIRNISCAAQDPEDLCTFAYITKDLQTSHHYCHVFSTVDLVRTSLSFRAGIHLGNQEDWKTCFCHSFQTLSRQENRRNKKEIKVSR